MGIHGTEEAWLASQGATARKDPERESTRIGEGIVGSCNAADPFCKVMSPIHPATGATTGRFIHDTSPSRAHHLSSMPKNFFFAKHIHHLFGEPSSLNKHCRTRCSPEDTAIRTTLRTQGATQIRPNALNQQRCNACDSRI